MCWSAGVSLNTFILVCFAAVIGLVNNVMTIWDTAFLLSYGSMQLIEYFLWTHIGNSKLNRVFSIVGLLAIMLQPLISILRIDVHGRPGNNKYKTGLLLAYTVFASVVLYLGVFTKFIDFRSTVAKNGHLAWHWLTSFTKSWGILIFVWMLLFFVPMIICKDYLSALFTVGVLLTSIFTFWKDETWGSMWCWVAAIASMHYIVQSFYVSGWCTSPK